MSDKLTQDDKWWLFCSSIPTGLAKKDIPVISVDTVKIKLHNLRFEQSEIEQQLLEANAKIERLEIAHLLMIDMHNDYHTCGEGDVDCTPCDKQDRAIEIFNETPTQSLALHDADVIESAIPVKATRDNNPYTRAVQIGWNMCRKELIDVVGQLRNSIKEGDK